jgi:hypothetical protein
VRKIEQPAGDKKEQSQRAQIDQQETEMYPGCRLPEYGHDRRVTGVGAWQLHIISHLVGWDAVQEQLAGVSVFPFVALQGDGQQAHPHHDDQKDGQGQRHHSPSARRANARMAVEAFGIFQPLHVPFPIRGSKAPKPADCFADYADARSQILSRNHAVRI